MIKSITKKTNNKKGFTLIELIVVIAILAILAALAIPRFAGTQETAKDRAHNSNVAILESAAQLALAENGNPTAAVSWTKAKSDADTAETDTRFNVQKYIAKGNYPAAMTGTSSTTVNGKDYTVGITTTGVITVAPAKIP